MSRMPISILVLALAAAMAAPPPQAGAVSSEPDDRQGIGGLVSRAPPKGHVALGLRRVAIADPDQSGVVSAAEAQAYYHARFMLMDRDRDQRLSELEFFRIEASRSMHVLEMPANARPLSFDAVDSDRDGAISAEEFLRADVIRRGWSASTEPEGGRRAVFDEVDADEDGTLSRHEFIAAAGRAFERSDADGDGRVTIWEFYSRNNL